MFSARLRLTTRTLNNLTRVQTRGLQNTGPATFSNLLTSERTKSTPEPQTPASSTEPVRHFNTNRALKTIKDSSPIDLTFIPAMHADPAAEAMITIPIVEGVERNVEGDEYESTIPTIFTVAADSTYFHVPSALMDVTDNNNVDFQGMAASRSGGSAAAPKRSAEAATMTGEESMIRQLWGGLKEDLFSGNVQRA